MEAPRQVEMILRHGKKSTTYKYALLKALIDFTIEHPSEAAVNGFHHIPAVYVAKKFLRYYWPLWKHGIPQSNRSTMALTSYFEEFSEDVRELEEGYAPDSPESVLNILERIETAPDLPTPYARLLQKIRRKLVDQPLRKVRKVRGELAQLFTVYHEDFSLIDYASEEALDEGRNYIRPSGSVENYLQLEDEEPLYILISHRVFEELVELRFWVDSIITKHWSIECQNYLDDGAFPYGTFFSSLSRDFGERDSLIPYRKFYEERGFDNFYTGENLNRGLHVDHFLPWSRLPVNRFWNLVPTTGTINSKKSDRLIRLTDEIREDRLRDHVRRCLEEPSELIEHDLRATYQKYFKREIPDRKDRQVEELRELVLTLYDDLDRVMVEEKVEPEKLKTA